jgi:hypothetical protein
MPRGPVHAFAGGATGAVVANRLAKHESPLFQLLETVAGLVGGVHGGLAPDKLEPAATPSHRGPFHSVAGAVISGVAVRRWAPEFLQQYRHDLTALHEDAQSETNPLWRLLKWLLVLCLHAMVGYGTGFAVGYASHLALDGVLTPSSLPLLTNGF